MKKIFYTVALTLVLSMSASAQVFVLENDGTNREGELIDPNLHNPDYHGSGEDWYLNYTPIGSGTLLLAGLAGAYLVGKKRKKN